MMVDINGYLPLFLILYKNFSIFPNPGGTFSAFMTLSEQIPPVFVLFLVRTAPVDLIAATNRFIGHSL